MVDITYKNSFNQNFIERMGSKIPISLVKKTLKWYGRDFDKFLLCVLNKKVEVFKIGGKMCLLNYAERDKHNICYLNNKNV
jgi:DNA modification methylase